MVFFMKLSDKYKQVIVIRTDIGMKTGKKCAQACHASISAAEESRKHDLSAYNAWKRLSGQRKIVLKIRGQDEIESLFREVKSDNIPCYLVKDAGLTQLEPGTITALGIGPFNSEKIDKHTGNLKLL